MQKSLLYAGSLSEVKNVAISYVSANKPVPEIGYTTRVSKRGTTGSHYRARHLNHSAKSLWATSTFPGSAPSSNI